MTYPTLNGSLMNDNFAYIFVYANSITHGFFMVFVVAAVFCVVLFTSIMMQLKTTGMVKPENSFAASCFATLGFAIIMEQVTGLLDAGYFITIVALTVLSVIWLLWDNDN